MSQCPRPGNVASRPRARCFSSLCIGLLAQVPEYVRILAGSVIDPGCRLEEEVNVSSWVTGSFEVML